MRQLVYDFRTWSRIEATGRLGADDGIDIRAVETEGVEPGPDGQEADADDSAQTERIWVIQCKRERELGPTAVKDIVKDGIPTGGGIPHGYILAAACDFSKKARDTFHDETKKRGVKEAYIWGKADLEDMLFQPRYDHLLFAYFNISLQVRRRSLRTSIRARLATKRAAVNSLGKIGEQPTYDSVLLRDPREENYPRHEKISDFAAFPRWRYATFLGHEPPEHLMFVVWKHFAYVDDGGERWDALFDFSLLPTPPHGVDLKVGQPAGYADKRLQYSCFWDKAVPNKNQAFYEVLRIIHYDRILAIDAIGDVVHPGIQILVEFDREHGPFEPEVYRSVAFGHYGFPQRLRPSEQNRISYFPKEPPPLEGRDEQAGGEGTNEE